MLLLFIVLVVLAATGILGDLESDPKPEPTVAAPAEPTATTTPTLEPVDSCSEGSGGEYLQYVAVALPVLWDDMAYVLELMEKAIGTDFLLLDVDEWRRELAAAVDYVRDDTEGLLTHSAPEFLKPVGGKYQQAASATREAAEAFAEFVDTRDEGTLASAFVAVDHAAGAAADAIRYQEALCEFVP